MLVNYKILEEELNNYNISPIQKRIIKDLLSKIKLKSMDDLLTELDKEQDKYNDKNSVNIGIYAGIEISKELVKTVMK